MATNTQGAIGGPQLIGVPVTSMSGGGLFTTPDGIQKTYRYCGTAFAPVAAPTDWLVIQGSASKTCRIRKIYVGGAATAAGSFPLTVVRRLSTGGTIGSAVLTAVVAGQDDNLDAAPTAVVSTVGTANYTTVQTANGVLAAGRVGLVALTAAAVYAPFVLELAYHKALVLRGTTDYIMLSFNAGAIPSGGVVDYEIVMEEDNS